jgi:hypothetical protein
MEAHSLEIPVEMIRQKILKDGPYDGFIGFSQGTMISRIFWRVVN